MVNESNLLNNNTLANNDAEIVYIQLVICIYGYAGEALSIFIIFTSRNKLISVEFYLLFTLIVYLAAIQLCFVWNFAIFFFPTLAPSYFISLILYVVLNICFYMTLFFYSLYHLSILNRAWLFVKLFNATRNIKMFFIYLILIFIFSIFLVAIYTVIDNSYQYNTKIIILLVLIGLPAIFPILTYFVAILLLVCSRFLNRKHQTSNSGGADQKELNNKLFKRNLKLIVRFSLLTLFIALGSLPQNFMINFDLFFPNIVDEHFKGIIMIVNMVFFVNQPIMIIVVHKILMQTFKTTTVVRMLFSQCRLA